MGAVLVANLTLPVITIPRSDETWLTEWSDGMGERSGARSPVAWGFGASQSSGHHNAGFICPEVWLVGGGILRDGRAHKRSRVQAGAEWRQPSLVTIES